MIPTCHVISWAQHTHEGRHSVNKPVTLSDHCRPQVTCLRLAALIICTCQSSFIWRVNKSTDGFGKVVGRKKEKKSHHKSAALGSSAITFCKWSSVFPVSGLPSVHIHRVNRAAPGLRLEGAKLFTFAAVWIDEAAEAERLGHDVNSWSIAVEREVFPPTPHPPQRWLTEFDKAVPRWDAVGTRYPRPLPLQEPRVCVRIHVWGSDER